MKIFSSIGDGRRSTMGWIQIRRLVSFIPAALFVYIVIYFLVYTPDVPGPHLMGTARHEKNFSMTAGVGVRHLQSGPRVIPGLALGQNSEINYGLVDIPGTEYSAVDQQNNPSNPLDNSSSTSQKEDMPLSESSNDKSIASEISDGISPNPKPKDQNEEGTVQISSSVQASVSTSVGGKAPKPQIVAIKTPNSGTGTLSTTSTTTTTTTKGPVLPKKKVALPKKPMPLAITALKGNIKVNQKYEPGFSVPHEELCPNNGRDLKVVVLITSAPDHERHRTAVRQTWGHFALRKDITMAFVVGRTNKPEVQNMIDRENTYFGDVIQTNFVDHYSNLTLKTVSMFEWVKTYCSESPFILKTDDDMFINMPLLFQFIESKKNEKHIMYGRLAKGWKPVRNKKSKYYIDTATFSNPRYPDFVTGPAYLFTNDVVDEIYDKILTTTFFTLEDVLLTGIVAESLKIKRVGDSRFRNEKIKLNDTCKLIHTISIHMVKYEEQFDIYKRIMDGKTKCKGG